MSSHARRGEMIKGSWSEAEDNELRALVAVHETNWSTISMMMTGRTAKQCRERWVQNLRPGITHGPFSPAECRFIIAYVEKHGQKWAEISRMLEDSGVGKRSDNAVKNWYNGTRNRQRRTAARQQRQSSAARSRAPPAPLNLSQPQRELPPSMSGQHTPTTPVYSEYGYGSHSQQHQEQQQYYSAPPQRYTAYEEPSPSTASSSSRQLPPLHDAIARDHRAQESLLQQQQQCYAQNSYHQQQQPTSSYSYSQTQPPRYADRRSSVYTTMGSPRSDIAYAPSLISDAGSPPSARESPMNAPVSPSTAIPSMMSTLPHPSEKELAALNLQSLRSSSSMDRSWSNRSDEHYVYQPQPQSQPLPFRRLPPPTPMEPAVMASRPTSRPSSRGGAMDLNNLLN
ncbi:hypothetical protein Sste5346_001143 [Sporothrix stenoceras]|uniref:Uncharacterized protein n=1 Tax=Sporothrix stenoceras TaxID=5173 RepID=A0ABR3ZRJ2_9PEZI